MGFTKSRAVMVFCFEVALGCTAPGDCFLGFRERSGRTITVHQVETDLRASLGAVLDGGKAGASQQLDRIEAAMWKTFQAMPKNSMGRLAPRAARHMIHNFFIATHGWIVTGLEPHGLELNMTEVHNASVLQEQAPALVEALLQARALGHGLSFSDVVSMAAALERLIFDESLEMLKAAYSFNGKAVSGLVGDDALVEILKSYLALFEMGSRRNLSNAATHQASKRRLDATAVEYVQDAANNFGYSMKDKVNPFLPSKYSFGEVWRMVEHLAQGYGKWQNVQCRQMKDVLIGLDRKGTGRVPLSAFHSQPKTAKFQFSESVAYLREVGSLDESGEGSPWVRIANYMEGPSNCLTMSSYYSVCCLSDCDALMRELEGEIQAPMALPEQLLSILGNLSFSSVDAPRELSQALMDKLHAIAASHQGQVPLHGRLFAQWMHFAFPNECPYPHISKDATLFKQDSSRRSAIIATPEERWHHIQEAANLALPDTDPLELEWSDIEVLTLEEPQAQNRSVASITMRAAVQLALVLSFITIVFAGMRTATTLSSHQMDDKKEKSFML